MLFSHIPYSHIMAIAVRSPLLWPRVPTFLLPSLIGIKKKKKWKRGRSCLGGVRFVSHLEWTETPKTQKPSRQERWKEFVRNNFREAASKSVSAAEDANVYESFSGPVESEKRKQICIDGGYEVVVKWLRSGCAVVVSWLRCGCW